MDLNIGRFALFKNPSQFHDGLGADLSPPDTPRKCMEHFQVHPYVKRSNL